MAEPHAAPATQKYEHKNLLPVAPFAVPNEYKLLWTVMCRCCLAWASASMSSCNAGTVPSFALHLPPGCLQASPAQARCTGSSAWGSRTLKRHSRPLRSIQAAEVVISTPCSVAWLIRYQGSGHALLPHNDTLQTHQLCKPTLVLQQAWCDPPHFNNAFLCLLTLHWHAHTRHCATREHFCATVELRMPNGLEMHDF